MLVQRAEKDGIRLSIYADETDYNNPRDWENVGTMLCWHTGYDLGDKQINLREYDDPKAVIDEILEDDGAVIMLPLFLMDHSGLSMRTSSAEFRMVDSAGWDWGQVGIIYATEKAIKSAWMVDEITDEIKERVKEVLVSEVGTYDQYLTGDIYAFVLERADVCSQCKHVEWETIDSCGGFFGHDWDANGMKDHIESEYHYLFEELEYS